jgi:hypothetical protein
MVHRINTDWAVVQLEADRFLLRHARAEGTDTTVALVLIQDCADELKRLVPPAADSSATGRVP